MYDLRDSKWHLSDEEDIGLQIQSVTLLLRALSLFFQPKAMLRDDYIKISDTTQ